VVLAARRGGPARNEFCLVLFHWLKVDAELLGNILADVITHRSEHRAGLVHRGTQLAEAHVVTIVELRAQIPAVPGVVDANVGIHSALGTIVLIHLLGVA
jgi:hypothetical protein